MQEKAKNFRLPFIQHNQNALWLLALGLGFFSNNVTLREVTSNKFLHSIILSDKLMADF